MELTYVRVSSSDIDQWLTAEVHGFASSLCQQGAETRLGKVRAWLAINEEKHHL